MSDTEILESNTFVITSKWIDNNDGRSEEREVTRIERVVIGSDEYARTILLNITAALQGDRGFQYCEYEGVSISVEI